MVFEFGKRYCFLVLGRVALLTTKHCLRFSFVFEQEFFHSWGMHKEQQQIGELVAGEAEH